MKSFKEFREEINVANTNNMAGVPAVNPSPNPAPNNSGQDAVAALIALKPAIKRHAEWFLEKLETLPMSPQIAQQFLTLLNQAVLNSISTANKRELSKSVERRALYNVLKP